MLYQKPQGSQNNLNKLTVGTIIEKVKNIYTIPDTSVEKHFFTIHWVERGEKKRKTRELFLDILCKCNSTEPTLSNSVGRGNRTLILSFDTESKLDRKVEQHFSLKTNCELYLFMDNFDVK